MANLSLFDTHAHLDESAFAEDLTEVIQRAESAGLAGILTVGVSATSSEAAIRLAETFPLVWAAVGIHPNYAAQAAPDDWRKIEHLVQHPRVVALGETGLDRHWHYTPFDVQQEYFRRHLELSRRTGLPVVIHCREAEADLRQLLEQEYRSHGLLRGILHSFSGTWETAELGLQLGLYISFAGMLTYKNADSLRQVARRVPESQLLIETDSPYLVPVPLRGKKQRNEPAYILHTLHCLAKVRNTEPQALAATTTANALRLFKITKTQ